MTKNKLIILAGPTASGKTSVSIDLAKRLGGEINIWMWEQQKYQ